MLIDITPLYSTCSDITVDTRNIDTNYIYMAIFSDASTWVPIDFAKNKNGKATFRNVGRNCVYLPIIYNKLGEMSAISQPIIRICL